MMQPPSISRTRRGLRGVFIRRGTRNKRRIRHGLLLAVLEDLEILAPEVGNRPAVAVRDVDIDVDDVDLDQLAGRVVRRTQPHRDAARGEGDLDGTAGS